jgi:hypothetical protein
MVQTESIFPTPLGVSCIPLALLNKQLLRLIGLRPLSEVFTTPRFQRSARITEKLGLLFLVIFGIGLLFQGVGTSLLPGEITHLASIGEISIDSQEGKGTSVRFTLPIYPDNPPSDRESTLRKPERLQDVQT